MSSPRVIFCMADYGHDPTETAVPFLAFEDAGFQVEVATENGKPPDCDEKMLKGITQKLLGATTEVCEAYDKMKALPAVQNPRSWTAAGFSFEPYNLLFLPGGHEKGVRQVIDSPIVQKLVAEYFPSTIKPSDKAVAAICHGVLAVSESTLENGKSALHDVSTTTLPAAFEATAYWGTKAFLGDYYKTYGAGSENVETSVKKRLADAQQYKCSIGPSPFVVEDEKYNYVSGRFPGDAKLLSEKAIAMVKRGMKPP